MQPETREPDASQSAPGEVNQHYLEHVMQAGESQPLEASEDIIASNGMKLLMRGARIDGGVKDKLLEHKLKRPLEQCIKLGDGATAIALTPICEQLLVSHPLLSELCANASREIPIERELDALSLTPALRSLFAVYCEHQPGRSEHAASVAMLALALARKLMPKNEKAQRDLAISGLFHDVGELYINPKYMRPSARLEPLEWRHIVAHPLVGARVMAQIEGAGPAVAIPIRDHHERLDGFGYPAGLRGEGISLPSQILAACEWLVGTMESARATLTGASIASKLMPGEFRQEILDEVLAAISRLEGRAASKAAADAAATGASGTQAAPASPNAVSRVADAPARIGRLGKSLGRAKEAQSWIDHKARDAGPELKAILLMARERAQRIQQAFSSAGLDAQEPKDLMAQLSALNEPALMEEVMAIISELEWRWRQLERESMLRAGALPPGEEAMVRELMEKMSSEASEG